MKSLTLALYKSGEVINLNKSGALPDSEVTVFIRGEHDGKPRANESWSYVVFDNTFKNIENMTFEWLSFTCTIASQDSWLYPLDDWTRSAHQWRRIKTVICNGSKSISINLRHTHHKGEAFKTLSNILSIAREQGLMVAKEEFREFSKQEPGA